MFTHAWHYITACTRWPTPYWFCAKCGKRSAQLPDSPGCNVEK